MTRHATVRLLTAAGLAVLIVGGTTASAYAVGAGVEVETVLLTIAVGVVSFSLLVMVLLFDSRRRHHLMRALRSRWALGRLAMRDRGPDEEQLAEMRRRLDYALEGIRGAVASEPAAVGATPGLAHFEDGRRPGPVNREAAREASIAVAARVPAARSALDRSTGDEPDQPRPPVSPRVAHGAPQVRLSTSRDRQSVLVAGARSRLTALRHDDERSIRRANVARWMVRGVLALIVPGVLGYEVLSDTSWLGAAWDESASRARLLVALALAVAGSVWVFAVTRRPRRRRLGALAKSESHAVRSLFAAEQLALRLAFGAAPPDAWRAASITNHFPAGSAVPAAGVDDALALVERLRVAARRRHGRSRPRGMAVVALPVLTCLLPAVVIIFLL